MQVTLPPELESLVQRQISSGTYENAIDVLLAGVQLLEQEPIGFPEENLIQDPIWIESTRTKVTQAIDSIKTNGGTDGDTAIAKLLDRYQQSAQQI
jgi:antitoxin ParD1/3/4